MRLLAFCAAVLCCSPSHAWERWQSLHIQSSDGTKLNARVAMPSGSPPTSAGFPAVVTCNSWAVPVEEYTMDALEWAAKDYLVLQYESRGFYGSGGLIDVAGPKDMADLSAVLDHLLAETSWRVDGRNIAWLGVSYGAGIGLIGAAHDARIKTVVALSGWGNLTSALYPHASPDRVWTELLIQSGRMTGREDANASDLDDLAHTWSDLETHRNVSRVVAWADARSAASYAHQLCSRRTPVLISNGLEDRLFHPLQSLDLRQELHAAGCPVSLVLSQGVHAEADIDVVAATPSLLYNRVRAWLGWQLLGSEPSQISAAPAVSLELRGSLPLPRQYLFFDDWPPAAAHTRSLALTGRGRAHEGSLSPDAAPKPSPSDETIWFGRETGLTLGLPVVGPALQAAMGVPISSQLRLVNTRHAAVFVSEPLAAAARLCGSPNATLRLAPSLPAYQVVAMLYRVNAYDQGTLLAHGPATVWGATPRLPSSLVVSLRTVCANILRGERLALGVSMWSEMYYPASDDAALNLTMVFGGQSQLHLPLLDPLEFDPVRP